MKDFTGKSALITGGAGGLGRAVGLALARAGAQVALWDSNEDSLKAASEAFLRENLKVRTYALDVSDRDAVREGAKRLKADLGEIDILDNNAGIVFPGTFLEASEADADRTLDVNIKSYLLTTRAFLPGMIERNRGHLIMTASAAGLAGVPGMAVYSASKHAVVGFSESLRLEIRNAGARGVGMTIVCPGFIDTGMFDGASPPFGMPWLKAGELADRVLKAVRSDKIYVREPFIVKIIPVLKVLPEFLQDWVGDITRMHESMRGLGKDDDAK